MKKVSLFIMLLFALSACQETNTPVNIEAEKAVLNEMFADYEEMIVNQETDSILTLYSEDVLICGSDPKEFSNKEEIKQVYDAMKGGDYPDCSFFGDRVIRVSPDGKSALVIEQMTASYSPNLPWRHVHYLIKKDNKWLINVSSSAIIPKNEDLPAVFMAVAGSDNATEE